MNQSQATGLTRYPSAPSSENHATESDRHHNNNDSAEKCQSATSNSSETLNYENSQHWDGGGSCNQFGSFAHESSDDYFAANPPFSYANNYQAPYSENFGYAASQYEPYQPTSRPAWNDKSMGGFQPRWNGPPGMIAPTSWEMSGFGNRRGGRGRNSNCNDSGMGTPRLDRAESRVASRITSRSARWRREKFGSSDGASDGHHKPPLERSCVEKQNMQLLYKEKYALFKMNKRLKKMAKMNKNKGKQRILRATQKRLKKKKRVDPVGLVVLAVNKDYQCEIRQLKAGIEQQTNLIRQLEQALGVDLPSLADSEPTDTTPLLSSHNPPLIHQSKLEQRPSSSATISNADLELTDGKTPVFFHNSPLPHQPLSEQLLSSSATIASVRDRGAVCLDAFVGEKPSDCGDVLSDELIDEMLNDFTGEYSQFQPTGDSETYLSESHSGEKHSDKMHIGAEHTGEKPYSGGQFWQLTGDSAALVGGSRAERREARARLLYKRKQMHQLQHPKPTAGTLEHQLMLRGVFRRQLKQAEANLKDISQRFPGYRDRQRRQQAESKVRSVRFRVQKCENDIHRLQGGEVLEVEIEYPTLEPDDQAPPPTKPHRHAVIMRDIWVTVYADTVRRVVAAKLSSRGGNCGSEIAQKRFSMEQNRVSDISEKRFSEDKNRRDSEIEQELSTRDQNLGSEITAPRDQRRGSEISPLNTSTGAESGQNIVQSVAPAQSYSASVESDFEVAQNRSESAQNHSEVAQRDLITGENRPVIVSEPVSLQSYREAVQIHSESAQNHSETVSNSQRAVQIKPKTTEGTQKTVSNLRILQIVAESIENFRQSVCAAVQLTDKVVVQNKLRRSVLPDLQREAFEKLAEDLGCVGLFDGEY